MKHRSEKAAAAERMRLVAQALEQCDHRDLMAGSLAAFTAATNLASGTADCESAGRFLFSQLEDRKLAKRVCDLLDAALGLAAQNVLERLERKA